MATLGHRGLRRAVDSQVAPYEPETVVFIDYTNHRGERAMRRVVPKRVWFGTTPWHGEPQWLLTAFDLDRQAQRDFALSEIHGFKSS